MNKGGKSITVSVKVTEEEFELIRKVTKSFGLNISNWIRLAIRRELARMDMMSDEEKKLLSAWR